MYQSLCCGQCCGHLNCIVYACVVATDRGSSVSVFVVWKVFIKSYRKDKRDNIKSLDTFVGKELTCYVKGMSVVSLSSPVSAMGLQRSRCFNSYFNAYHVVV